MAKFKDDNKTIDLFETVYPVRSAEPISSMSFDSKLRRAISKALKECPLSREEIAAKMAEILDCPNFSKAMLDAYSAESRNSHPISVIRLKALVQVTHATWIWDEILKDDGLMVMEGEEARLAQLGLAIQEKEKWSKVEKELRAKAPVKIRRGQ